jgi:hypothetical protein
MSTENNVVALHVLHRNMDLTECGGNREIMRKWKYALWHMYSAKQ